jgi:hypothetical protein
MDEMDDIDDADTDISSSSSSETSSIEEFNTINKNSYTVTPQGLTEEELFFSDPRNSINIRVSYDYIERVFDEISKLDHVESMIIRNDVKLYDRVIIDYDYDFDNDPVIDLIMTELDKKLDKINSSHVCIFYNPVNYYIYIICDHSEVCKFIISGYELI